MSLLLRTIPCTTASCPRRRPTGRRWIRRALAAIAPLLCACGPPDELPAEAELPELLSWARRQQEAGNVSGATEGYRRVLLLDSLHTEALAGLADVYEVEGRGQLADRYRKRAFHLHYDRGVAWFEAEHSDSARAAFTQALELLPQHPLVHMQLGQLELARGRHDSAIASFQRAAEANPGFSRSWVVLGQALASAGQTERAQAAFEHAVEVNINALDAYLGLGSLFALESRWPEAAAQYEKALLIDPRSEAALRGLEQVRARL